MEKVPLDGKRQFDDIWDELPHGGRYQIKLVVFSSYMTLIMGLSAMYPVFAQYSPKHHCRTSLDDLTFLSLDQIHDLSTKLQGNCASTTKSGCEKCSYPEEIVSSCINQTSTTSFSNSTSDDIFNCLTSNKINGSLETCGADGNVFLQHGLNASSDSWESAVTQFDLVCEKEILNTYMISAGSVGFFIGSLLAGVHCDTFGRKNAIMVHTLTTTFSFAAQALIVNQYAFLVLRTLAATFSVIGFLSALTYGVEILGPSRRSLPSTILCFMFAGGCAGISVISFYLPDWQNLTLGIAALSAFNIIFLPFLPESPRFLVTKGRYEEAQAILDRFAIEASDQDGEPLIAPDISLFVIEKPPKAPPITDILFSKFFGKVFILTSMAYFVVNMVYYGFGYGVNNLSGSIYVNNAINGALEAAAYGFTAPITDVFGRRKSIVALFILSGVACFAHMGVLLTSISTNVAAFIGKFASSAVFCALFTFSAELFPTEVRSMGVSITSMIGRIGSVVAPFLNMLIDKPGFEWVPHTTFATLSILSGFLLLFLPETKSLPLFQTVEEAEEFHASEKKKRNIPN
ncbi:Oidioi.mRNA.OKI2018_I69.PAR.g11565.t1.cds [Oikopleura dioica]|uniref:Oidioi.mRNA.OKI2018_I69.PAR.g11565.t1.cds n=1 Tax=Oikopleura dioica TaxID=34765 RepID=A0ABN7S3L3_OIKDI|nr:Oidioi.mRNA.OKI2018_I69.PAR.g11565.t1.cds [Oikopleura dioica]